MAGHSKWANIKRKKEKTDAQRGKIFTKLGREIAVAVKEGGSDPEANPQLRDAIAKAKSENMPNDTIKRSIKKASGGLGTVNYEEITYEGYGPNGVAIIVEALTDNRNRTASDIRHIFDRHGGSLGATGCVAWMFERKGLLITEKSQDIDEDAIMMHALEAGAEDISDEGDIFEIITSPSDFSEVREYFEKLGYSFVSAEVAMLPQNYVKVDNDVEDKVMALIEGLEDHDDVQSVFYNVESD